jgi:hypothetical protein
MKALSLVVATLSILVTSGVMARHLAPPRLIPNQVRRDCLALGFGSWLPKRPNWLTPAWWREPPHLRLLGRSVGSLHGKEWYGLDFAPGAESAVREKSGGSLVRLADFLWAWRAPQPDSLELIRVAALSEGLSVTGTWRGDTLRGRAHAYSDVISPETDPRGNAYAVRYDCSAPTGATTAAHTLHMLLLSDRPDSVRNAREAMTERARWDSVLRAR